MVSFRAGSVSLALTLQALLLSPMLTSCEGLISPHPLTSPGFQLVWPPELQERFRTSSREEALQAAGVARMRVRLRDATRVFERVVAVSDKEAIITSKNR